MCLIACASVSSRRRTTFWYLDESASLARNQQGEASMKMAAIYARVSSAQQREQHTIASQTAALIEFAKTHELEVPREWVFEDEGYSGATLERPGLERVRDLAAEGQIQVVLTPKPPELPTAILLRSNNGLLITLEATPPLVGYARNASRRTVQSRRAWLTD